MTPRERWLALFEHRVPDRIPTDYTATPEVTARLLRGLDCPDLSLNLKDWSRSRSSILCYEAGPFPVWRVNAAEIPVAKLKREGYHPRRYQHIRD